MAGVAQRGIGGGGPRRSRLWRRGANLLIVAGGLLLAYPFWSAGFAHIEQGRLGSAYAAQTKSFGSTVAKGLPGLSSVASPAVRLHRLAHLYAASLKPGDPIGRLIIPRIALNRVVQQGVAGPAALDPGADRGLLRNGPVHYGMTPLPGLGEPFAVAGHRTTYGAPFSRLDELRAGDPIVLQTAYARLIYRVSKATVVLPSDVSVLADRGYAIVLTTCTPRYSASHRLVMWGTLSSY
jgi:sortase A